MDYVYTREKYRRCGFATILVTYISKLIISDGKIPILYTDLANPASNKAYKSAGFVERGKIDEVTLTFK